MVPFDEGYEIIRALAAPLPAQSVALAEAYGRVLRTDLVAARPHPATDNSAMDGYALCGESEDYALVGEVAAGQEFAGALRHAQAVRIFTGAKIPAGTDRILIQENAVISDGLVRANPRPEKNANIRRAGSDYDIGFTLPAPKRLTPQDVALAGAMNFAKVDVSPKPRVAILATGDELVSPGQAQNERDVIASNAYGIKALAESYGAVAEILPLVGDDFGAIQRAMDDARADLLITTGGASVGKFDYVKDAAVAAGFQIAVHKIALRPGKPIMAGTRGDQVFMGLPGNPVSAMICAQIFMRAVLLKMQGLSGEMPSLKRARTQADIPPNGDRTHFLRTFIKETDEGYHAHPLRNQDSAAVSLLAKANGLIVLQPDAPVLSSGEFVNFIWT